MRALRIEADGVTEIDVPEDFLEASENDWDCLNLDGRHDVWVDEMGFFAGTVDVAAVGLNRTVPLPAYVLGRDGERTVGASISIEEVRAVVTVRGRSSGGSFAYASSSDCGATQGAAPSGFAPN